MSISLPYEPPVGPNDPDPSISYTISSENLTKVGIEKNTESTVGVTAEGEAKFLTIWHAKLKVDGSWTWSTTSNTEDSIKVTELATVKMAGPSFGYAGPTIMAVYYDTLYRTFLFIPRATALGLTGRIMSSGNAPSVIGGIRVTLEINRQRYTTFTNRRGEYRFPAVGAGRGLIRFANMPARPTIVGPNRTYDLRLQ